MVRKEITREATLGQLLDETVAKYPDNEAIVYADRDYRETWSQFSTTVDRVAKGLMALGVKKGDKVAVWATNVPHWVTLQFATAKIGAILLTININYKTTEIEYVLKQSDCENIFIIDGYRDTDYVNIMYELMPELKTQPRDKLHTERFPHLQRVMFLGPEKHRGMYSMPEVMALAAQVTGEEYKERQATLSCYDVVNMQYTSGTTGFPKGRHADAPQHRQQRLLDRGEHELQREGPDMPAGAAVPLLRLRAGGHGQPELGQHHGHPGEVRPGDGHDGRGEGEVHRRLRRPHHVHQHAGAPALQQVRLQHRCAPGSWPAPPAR